MELQYSGRASPSTMEEEEVLEREREAPKAKVRCPPSPPLYIGPRERGRTQPCPFLQGRVRPRGEGVHPPQGTSEVPSPFRTLPLSYLLAHGPLWAGSLGPYRPRRTPTAHVPPRDRWPHPVDPRDPSGGPGTIPVTPQLVPMAEIALPIYDSLPPDHSGTPRDVRDLIRDSEQHSGYCIYISL